MSLLKSILLISFVMLSGVARGAAPPLQEAWRLGDEARKVARSGEGWRALALYDEALALAPGLVDLRRDYATVLGWEGYHQEASREFATVMEQEPEQPVWAVREMANASFFGGNDAEALKAFDRLIEAGCSDEPLLIRRGLTLLRLGRPAEAEQQYRQALGWNPDSEAAAVGLGRALAGQSRLEAAYTLAVTWGAGHAPDSDIRIFAAEMLAAMGRHAEAVEAFDSISAERLAGAGLEAVAEQSRLLAHGGGAPSSEPERAARQGLSPPIGTIPKQAVARVETLRDAGIRAAREGDLETGLEYLEQYLQSYPEHIDSIRDYAIVLGWSERYGEALEQFDHVLAKEPEQPIWARSELARNQLFGGRTAAALATLNGLEADGYADATTLSRRGLALRWLGRSDEACAVYRRLSQQYPDSSEGVKGLVQALADRNHLADALEAGAEGLKRFPDDGELKVRLAQTMNWAGMHVHARRVLEALPQALHPTKDVLHQRTLAARWASRPKEAFELALAYRQLHPDDPQSGRLLRELSYEYGPSVDATAEGVSDSAGYSYRSTMQRATIPLSLSHRLSFLRERRSYADESQPGELAWSRYGAAWTGVLGRRVTAYASGSSIDYGLAGDSRRMIGDASVSALLTDRVTASAGFGVAPAETLPALQERLMGRYVWGSVKVRPTLKVDAEARYVRRDYTGASVRQTTELSAFRMVSQRGAHKIRVGGRSQWMWHDRYTPLFWSPSFFYTQIASVRMEGSLPGRIDYAAEAGSGIQREAGYDRQIPLVTTIEIAKKLQPQLWLRVKAGYSNSSIDRLNTGSGAYRFRYFSAGLDFRLGRRG